MSRSFNHSLPGEPNIEIMKPALALLCLTLICAMPQGKGRTMTHRASGAFEVKMEPMASGQFPRMSLAKQFRGDLEGTSTGEMMSVGGTVEGSGAYVALEQVTASL